MDQDYNLVKRMNAPEEQNEPQYLTNRWAKEGKAHSVVKPMCQCLNKSFHGFEWGELPFHRELQDTSLPAWHRVLQLIDDAIADGRSELSFAHLMEPGDWAQIVTLPRSIAKLKNVKHLNLYGSSLVRIPPEIGQMDSLEVFTPYTSRRLHWFPYEITRCKNLRDSTVSTRSIYGNFKFRPPFPKLPIRFGEIVPKECSVCSEPLTNEINQVWISLGVATDVLPLLVHACSQNCIDQLPKPNKGYVKTPHTGGVEVEQPNPERMGKRFLQDRLKVAEGLMGEELQKELSFIGRMAVEDEYPHLFDEIIRRGFDISQPNGLLHVACACRDLEMAKRLIDMGADVNELSEFGTTSLMEAADYGFLAGVQILLEQGADPNIRSRERKPQHIKAIDIAIEGLDEWRVENDGFVPPSVESEYRKVIELLEQAGKE